MDIRRKKQAIDTLTPKAMYPWNPKLSQLEKVQLVCLSRPRMVRNGFYVCSGPKFQPELSFLTGH